MIYSHTVDANRSYSRYLYSLLLAFYLVQVHGFDPTGLLWRQGMHGTAYANIDYAQQYPSKSKHFHNWGVGAADVAVYPPGSVPQVRMYLIDG